MGALCAYTLLELANTAQARLVNQILGLDIGGNLYNVTFHTGANDSFNALWDADNDGVFSGGGSVFSSAPKFWGDVSRAQAAAEAIIAALGLTDTTSSNPTSGNFLAPYCTSSATNCSTLIPSTFEIILGYGDLSNASINDSPYILSVFDAESDYTSFLPYASLQAVPIPPAT